MKQVKAKFWIITIFNAYYTWMIFELDEIELKNRGLWNR